MGLCAVAARFGRVSAQGTSVRHPGRTSLQPDQVLNERVLRRRQRNRRRLGDRHGAALGHRFDQCFGVLGANDKNLQTSPIESFVDEPSPGIRIEGSETVYRDPRTDRRQPPISMDVQLRSRAA